MTYLLEDVHKIKSLVTNIDYSREKDSYINPKVYNNWYGQR